MLLFIVCELTEQFTKLKKGEMQEFVYRVAPMECGKVRIVCGGDEHLLDVLGLSWLLLQRHGLHVEPRSSQCER